MPNLEKKSKVAVYIDKNERYGGILLHPTSLPSSYGIGDLGPEAYRFVDFLHNYNLQLWQVLPLGPTGYGDSPYQCFSAFAGNPMLISPIELQKLGILSKAEIDPSENFSETEVVYEKIIAYKWRLLSKAYDNYLNGHYQKVKRDYNSFKRKEKSWLEDYALFMAIKKETDLQAWNTWTESLRIRKINALKAWKKEHSSEVEFQKFVQFIFFSQWQKLKKYAHLRNIKIIGDIPIFVAYDSSDVWANPELFFLDDQGKMIYIAGVPPDYFSESGQRWGNPLYRWEVLKERKYSWWKHRIKHALKLVDFLRIDHFRGFESYWRIPASEPTAIVGEWIPGPGINFFNVLKKTLGDLPIIAEDLGIITKKVDELLVQTGFPGMRILQFAFSDPNEVFAKNRFLPHNYNANTVVYTGTHDNDTTLSWFNSIDEEIQERILKYICTNGKDIVGDLIRLAWGSTAKMAIIPLQDLLRFGNEGRMNFPGTTSDNWRWRFTWEQLTKERGEEIAKLSKIYGRQPTKKTKME